MYFGIPDPLRNIAKENITVQASTPLECIMSLFAIQSPDAFPRGRDWRQIVLPQLTQLQRKQLNFYFPEGYFGFSMGVFGGFLEAPKARDMQELTTSWRKKAQFNSPKAMPILWNDISLKEFKEFFRQNNRVNPPQHLIERFTTITEEPGRYFDELIEFLNEYFLIFKQNHSTWQTALLSGQELLTSEVTNKKIDLLEISSKYGEQGIPEQMIEKLRQTKNLKVILIPSHFSYPYIANLDYKNIFYLCLPIKATSNIQGDFIFPTSPYHTDKELSVIFKALSDETRLSIIGLLKDQKMYGLEVAQTLGLTQPTASHHLSYLLKADLLTTE